jgi:hypothetical protein
MAICLMVMPVFAEDGSPPGDIAESYITWEFLGTMSGATAAVLLIVQFLKAPLDRLWKIPTRLVAYFFAIVILIAVEIVTKGALPFDRFFLLLLNAIIVAVAAMGAYAATFQKHESKNNT